VSEQLELNLYSTKNQKN